MILGAHKSNNIFYFSAQGAEVHSSSMSHSAQTANQIKQEAGFTTLPLPSCFDAGRCGMNGGKYKRKWRWQIQMKPDPPGSCDRTNSRKCNDTPRIQCDAAILTHHRNFPANLTIIVVSHNFLPSAATPRAEILPCGHGADTSRVLIRCKQLEWLHQTWILNTAHVHTEDSEIDLASIFYNFPQGVRGPFYIESGNISMKCNEHYLFCCE